MPRTYTTKREIMIAFDTDSLQDYSDQFLATLWHVAQANPAPITDRDAGDTAEAIGREIIRRWMERVPVALWNHQGRHAPSCVLTDNGHWPGPDHDRWVFGKSDDTRADVERRAGELWESAVHKDAPSASAIPATQSQEAKQ
jgi:hypothetical protein